MCRYAALPALRVKRRGVWQEHTWAKYRDEATAFARALLSLGLRPFDTVGIMSFNCPGEVCCLLQAVWLPDVWNWLRIVDSFVPVSPLL